MKKKNNIVKIAIMIFAIVLLTTFIITKMPAFADESLFSSETDQTDFFEYDEESVQTQAENDALPSEMADGISDLPDGLSGQVMDEILGDDPESGLSTFAAVMPTGDGSLGNPYLITNADELLWVAQTTNSGIDYTGIHFLLANDIDLNDGPWIPIGIAGNNQELIYNHTITSYAVATNKAFKGIFDGGGHTVKNFISGITSVNVGVNADFKGLFGIMYGATVKNLSIQNAKVYGGSGLGSLVGYVTGNTTIDNVHISNSMILSAGDQNFAGGGMIGEIDIEQNNIISITNSTVNNTYVQSSAVYGRVGGMIGCALSNRTNRNISMNAKINLENLKVNDGSVTSYYYYMGGLLGEVNFYNSGGNEFKINNCYSSSKVVSTSAAGYYVGGLVGFSQIQNTSPGTTIIVENSSASGNIEAKSYYVGGLIGYSEVTTSADNIRIPTQIIVRNSSASGQVTTDYTEGANIGGFIGHAHAGDNMPAGSVLVEGCSSSGDVSSVGYNVGGFMGRPTKNVLITNSFSTGDVYGGRNHNGAFIGYTEGNDTYGSVIIENSYATGNLVSKGYYTGGFVGFCQSTRIKNSYSIGSVNSNSYNTGGFIGFVSYNSYISNSYSTGRVYSTVPNAIGGFIGMTSIQPISIVDCYFDTTTSQRTNAIGTKGGATTESITPMNTTDMISLAKYRPTWDMKDNILGLAGGAGSKASPWYIDNDATYPYLYYQYDGHSKAETNYALDSVLVTDDYGLTYKHLQQFLYDFKFDTNQHLMFSIKTAGAKAVYFPYTHGAGASDYNTYRYRFGGNTLSVPKSGAYDFNMNTLYSLGSISATNIVAFSSFPMAEKTSDRPEYVAGDDSTYTYVGDRVTYTITATNFSNQLDWKNIVLSDVLPLGLTLVHGSVEIDGATIGTTVVPKYEYNSVSRELLVYLEDMPKISNTQISKKTISYQVDIEPEAASTFPLNPQDDNIRNKGIITGDLYNDTAFFGNYGAEFDDENKDPVFPKYSVIYNANGGTFKLGNTEYHDGFYLPDETYFVKYDSDLSAAKGKDRFLNWSTTPDGSGTIYYGNDIFKIEQNTVLYAIWMPAPKLEFYKVDGIKSEQGIFEGLEGAEFDLYTWNGSQMTNYPQVDNALWQYIKSGVSDFSQNSKGRVEFEGMEFGMTYLIVERKAPNGYELANAQWLLQYDGFGDLTIGNMVDGEIAYQMKFGDVDTTNLGDELYVPNYKLSDEYELPLTGGMGTKQLTIIGISMMTIGIVGVVGYEYVKRKKERKN